MYIDLNVPVPVVATSQPPQQSKKGKGKQPQTNTSSSITPSVVFTPGQLTELEARIDLLAHLGYTVIAFNQTVQNKIDPKTHVNTLDPLLAQLKKRSGVAYAKRLTIVLDEESEKGFGLTVPNSSLFTPYDLIALIPTTTTSFSLACLTHTAPSPLTAHIISLPLTLPRLPFNLKHTLVRTALKNGAVFEIPYVGALGADPDPALGASAGGEGGSSGRRNWWAAAREIVRVTKGRGIIVTSGAVSQTSLRSPKDIGNLITMLGLPQNVAHDASTKTPQSLLLRAQTRRTYRAIFSEPRIVIPEAYLAQQAAVEQQPTPNIPPAEALDVTQPPTSAPPDRNDDPSKEQTPAATVQPSNVPGQANPLKRPLEKDSETSKGQSSEQQGENPKKKRKKGKSKESKTK